MVVSAHFPKTRRSSLRLAVLARFSAGVLLSLAVAPAPAADRFVPVGQGVYDVPGFAETLDVSADGRRVVYAGPGGVYEVAITDPTDPVNQQLLATGARPEIVEAIP